MLRLNVCNSAGQTQTETLQGGVFSHSFEYSRSIQYLLHQKEQVLKFTSRRQIQINVKYQSFKSSLNNYSQCDFRCGFHTTISVDSDEGFKRTDLTAHPWTYTLCVVLLITGTELGARDYTAENVLRLYFKINKQTRKILVTNSEQNLWVL